MHYNFVLDSRYFNGKIYKMYSQRLPDLCYIGSTIQTLADRFKQHKWHGHNKYLINMFEKYNDIVIELIEKFPCFNDSQLVKREHYYINEYISLYNVSLNIQKNIFTDKGKCVIPDGIVDWFLQEHKEYDTVVGFIRLRDS